MYYLLCREVDDGRLAEFQCTIGFSPRLLKEPVAYRYLIHSTSGTSSYSQVNSFESLIFERVAVCRCLMCDISEGM